MRKAVFMDIDGTLMYNGAVSERVVASIKRARARGHMFFVCTGRSKVYLPEPLKDTDYLDGFVYSCGMHCEVGGKTIYIDSFEKDELLSIARYVSDTGAACHFEGDTKILSINSTRTDFAQVDTYDELVDGFETENIYKISVVGENCLKGAPELFERFAAFDMGHYADVVRKGTSKATGIKRVLAYTGIPRADSIGIGDGSNDLPMINFCGLGVAMGNAPEHVKAQADAVTESCENDGVAAMIERFILND